MATKRTKAQSFFSVTQPKTFFKVTLAVALVIFALSKVLNDTSKKYVLKSTNGNSINIKNIHDDDQDHKDKQQDLVHLNNDLLVEENGNKYYANQNVNNKFKSENDHQNDVSVKARSEDIDANAFRKLKSVWNSPESMPKDAVYVMISLANVQSNPVLQAKFQTCVTTMSDLSSATIVLFVVGDKDSKSIAEHIVSALPRKNIQMHFVSLDVLSEEMKNIISTMQQHFSYKPGSYYSHALFFLSIAIHRLTPPFLSRLVMLDADLKFKGDIKQLYDHFDIFSPSNVIGIAFENQPVYRHVLAAYRKINPGTRAGDPPPSGLPGFNSGVLLMDLKKMRKSELYNSLLDSDIVSKLAEKYSYKGHLGDQDFYSLVALEKEDLFYILPCVWNRQLCQWWRDKGYETVFDSYYACAGEVKIYHGNCNTPFPSEH